MQMIKKLFVVVLACLSLSACVTTNVRQFPQSNVQMGSVGQVEEGVVLAIRVVSVPEATSSSSGYVGTAAGAAIGAAVGSRIGKGRGKTAATVLGGVLGGATGHAIATAPSYTTALEIEVGLNSGRHIIVTQAPVESFQPGQRVRVISNGGRVRVSS